MKNLQFFFILICFLVFGCKKKDSTSSAPDSGATTGATSVSNGTGTTNYDALFEIIKTSNKINNNYGSFITNCKALLCAQTVTNEVQLNFMDMGAVNLNGTLFSNHLGSILYYYVDSTYSNFSTPYIWSVNGNSDLGVSSYTTSATFPSYNNFSSLPDSISKGSGVAINLGGLGGCDFIQLTIIGPSGSQYLSPKIAPGNSSNISYSPSELTTLNTGSGYFVIKFLKDNIQIMNNKKVNIRTGICYTIIGLKIKA